jgi:hypothetical protein
VRLLVGLKIYPLRIAKSGYVNSYKPLPVSLDMVGRVAVLFLSLNGQIMEDEKYEDFPDDNKDHNAGRA